MKWTIEENEFIKNNFIEMDNIELAKRLNRTTTSICGRMPYLKLKRPQEWNIERMKENNPMKNKDTTKKRLKTIKEKYPNWGNFNKGKKDLIYQNIID